MAAGLLWCRGQIRFVRKGPNRCSVKLTISYEVPGAMAPFASVSAGSGLGSVLCVPGVMVWGSALCASRGRVSLGAAVRKRMLLLLLVLLPLPGPTPRRCPLVPSTAPNAGRGGHSEYRHEALCRVRGAAPAKHRGLRL